MAKKRMKSAHFQYGKSKGEDENKIGQFFFTTF
jgi:hypothetical protein